ncbi:MAG: D-alanyl-D-alanine carboxypeptidase [Erysipelotrichaceae bacterium]|nr:D-alanyl-D-alanine carboxypeptidase [Erysipelotrichaceae bacterium]
MKKILLIITCLLLFTSCKEKPFTMDTSQINVIRDAAEEFDFKIHSNAYMLVDMSNFVIQYKYRNDHRIFPASLTKVVTLDTVLNMADSLDDLSYVTYDQVEALIREDASLAFIQRDYDYTLRDLLYALILPSGADGAVALENYFESKGMDLVEEMNKLCDRLGCSNSHFVNSTGLHDNDHYTSLNDLFLVVMDVLKFKEGREILESLYYTMEDGTKLATSVKVAQSSKTKVLGGKTGYTPEAGQNLVVLYKSKGRSYILLIANAYGSYIYDEYWHFEDAWNIFEHLYY